MKTLIITLLVVIGAASANAQKVKVKADPSVDLSTYKTYTLSKGGMSPNPIIHQTIVEALERAMTAKGLTKVETGADITVVAWAATESDLHVAHPSASSAMGTAISTGIAVGSQTWPVTKGTLVVDLADAKTKNSVWRATATDTLEEGPSGSAAKDAKRVEKKINKAVEKMFKKFPRP